MVIVVSLFFLTACGRSPDSQFYLLSPLPPQHHKVKSYKELRIGITQINSPAFTRKPEFIIHHSKNRVELDEFHRWAELLHNNIQEVIVANLMTLLPHALILNTPWDSKFNQSYQLRIDISQFEVDIYGHSVLRADYLIYNADGVSQKGTLYYHRKAPRTTVDALVASMNDNLNRLCVDIAKKLAF